MEQEQGQEQKWGNLINRLRSLLGNVEHNRPILSLLQERLDMLENALDVSKSMAGNCDEGLVHQIDAVLNECQVLVKEHTDLCGKSFYVQWKAYCSHLNSRVVASKVPELNKRLELCALTLKALCPEGAAGPGSAEGRGGRLDDDSTGSPTEEYVEERTVRMEEHRNALFFQQQLMHRKEHESEVAEWQDGVQRLESQLNWSLSVDFGEDGQQVLVGAGRLGQVFHGKMQGKDVAVKELPNHNVLQRAENYAEFGSEHAFLISLQHKNVLQVYGANPRKEPPYIVMEWAEKGSLLSFDTASLSWSGKAELLLQAARGLNYLHMMQRTHLDITSEHVLVGADPETMSGFSVKIGGLGLTSTKATTERYTNWQNCQKSTVLPLAPPEFEGGVTYGRRSDVFQFGVVMYELVGSRPTKEHDVDISMGGLKKYFCVPADCPTQLKEIMAACCAANAFRRPSMMEAEMRLDALFHSLLNLQEAIHHDSFCLQSKVAECKVCFEDVIYNQNTTKFLLEQIEKVAKVTPLQTPALQEWKESYNQLIARAIKPAHKVISRHGNFNLERYYKVDAAKRCVEIYCDQIKLFAQQWDPSIEISCSVPEEYLKEDRKFWNACLAYVVDDGQLLIEELTMSKREAVLCKWGAAKEQHGARMSSLRVVSAGEVTVGEGIGGGQSPVCDGELSGRRVAIKKCFSGKQPLSHEDLLNFMNEAYVQASLDHQHTADLIAVTTSGWMLMELALCNLHRWYQTIRPDWKSKIRLLLHSATGLEDMHNRDPPVTHCDVKTANILMFGSWEDPSGCIAKIADFGLSKAFGQTTKSTQRNHGGTLVYTAPELLDGQRPSCESDVFSFGVVMYELASEEQPYGYFATEVALMGKKMKSQAPCRVPSTCPLALSQLMERCCSFRPGGRPSMRDVRVALRHMSPP